MLSLQLPIVAGAAVVVVVHAVVISGSVTCKYHYCPCHFHILTILLLFFPVGGPGLLSKKKDDSKEGAKKEKKVVRRVQTRRCEKYIVLY